MATVSLFFHPVFRDGAFTSNDPEVRAYALQKTLRTMDIGAELGAKIFALWGGREGVETDACRRADVAIQRLRDAVNYLCAYNMDQGYGFKFALEAKPTNLARIADDLIQMRGIYTSIRPSFSLSSAFT